MKGYEYLEISKPELEYRIMIALEEIAKSLANYDRKTEPSNSEKPNNYCDDCLYTDTCDSKKFFYACTSKATISKMEQVDKDINVRSKDEPTHSQHIQHVESVETMSCQECKHWKYVSNFGWDCEFESVEDCKYEPKDEPQTDCPWK